VATVPQVATYLINGEVDVGFINLSVALIHKDRLGGYILIDELSYAPIYIVAATLKKEGCSEIGEFVEFLKSDYSKKILKDSGL
jgi:molybdate transport system substrate-binding protein